MELEAYLRFGLALLFVLGLIGLCAWGAKRLGMTPRVSAGAGRAKRRLVLVRRDDREHLLLLGAAQDVVVESGIAAPAAELAT
jgi:flagellar protein FliO/FliZ